MIRLEEVSRLKGIETIAPCCPQRHPSSPFGRSFPFEGNWNSWLPQERSCHLCREFGRSFPFEGNWNLYWCLDNESFISLSLEEVSRLKGIETLLSKLRNFLFVRVWKKFPVWRELKHPSMSMAILSSFLFGRSFPFEGNWNLYWCLDNESFISLSLEEVSRLKGIETRGNEEGVLLLLSLEEVSRLKGIETVMGKRGVRPVRVWKKFPVWRELKRRCPCRIVLPVEEFGRSFPFEGNWNNQKRESNSDTIDGLEEVSRLKGIETRFHEVCHNRTA